MGEPVRKSELFARADSIHVFIIDQCEMVRDILDFITSLTAADIDHLTGLILSPSISNSDRARYSWQVVAWHTIIKPYEHPRRQHVIDLSPFVRYIEKDADAYFTYAVMILKKPSREVYERLLTLHPGAAKTYQSYCRNYAIAEGHLDIEKWMFNW